MNRKLYRIDSKIDDILKGVIMHLGVFEIYLIVINVVGFILFAINTWLYNNTAEGEIDSALTIVALLGGSLGIIISICIFDFKAEKGNMMSRVFVASVFVIQIVIYLIVKGFIKTELTIAFWNFFRQHKYILGYLVIMNVIAFIAYAIDKYNAIEHRSRIRNVSLLALAFLGGSIGALLSMYTFRHKTSKDYYTVGVPLILIMQIVVIFYLMNMRLK